VRVFVSKILKAGFLVVDAGAGAVNVSVQKAGERYTAAKDAVSGRAGETAVQASSRESHPISTLVREWLFAELFLFSFMVTTPA